MPYDLNSIGYMSKYDNIKMLVDVEVTPLLDVLLKLSNIANNFSSTANRIANIDIRETHEIKEFLELTFDARKLAEKVEDVVDFRVETVVEAARCCYYEMKPPKKPDGDGHNDLDAIIAAGNKIVNKNVVNKDGAKKDTEKGADKKGEKPSEEKVKEKEEAKPKDANPKDKNAEGTDKEKKEEGRKSPFEKKQADS